MNVPPESPPGAEPAGTGRSARLVATGILLSRIAGLVRERVFAQYFGTTLYAGAFRAALRMPNVLQNLLGEGTLSASFIPVYAQLLQERREAEAGRVAGAVFALLLALAGGLSLLGVLLAPLLVTIFSPGFQGEERRLTIAAVRVLFPMTGLLVLSAWALGILNSHRRFFLPYVAPVLWNAAMIATLVFFGGRLPLDRLLVALAWGAFAGGLLQFAVQLPGVLRLERDLRVRWDTGLPGVRTAVRNALPAIAGRGVVQLSSWLDIFLASLIGASAVAALGYAQTLWLLPISLFGMSIAAAELPELARERGAGEELLRQRVERGLQRIALFVVPTVVGYLLIGDVVVATIYETGRFGGSETAYVRLVLAGYTLGLYASTTTRLYSSACFALHDTRTPARYAIARVVLAGTLGASLMFWLERYRLGTQPLGAVGLATASGIAAWLEWALLRRYLAGRLGRTRVPGSTLLRLAAAALLGCGAGAALLLLLPPLRPELAGMLALGTYGTVYFPAAAVLGVPEAARLLRRTVGRLRP